LCNSDGEVIGINSLKVSSYGNAFAMGFAINSNEAQDIIKALKTEGKVIKPSIGIYGKNYGEMEISADVSGVEGVYVQDVIEGSGASEAGIMHADIITEIGGHSVKNMEDINNILAEYKVNDDVPCKIWRSGKIKNISIVLSQLKVN
ncbi:MAG: PDZ domain-containing protein, partial [Clostridiaceae bacterium]|nr:PDZ domain-containing protein [Clostridiaceae bacterium]